MLYLSLGFKQHYLLQVLTLSRPNLAELHMVLYDGLAYTGAVYRSKQVSTLTLSTVPPTATKRQS